MYRYLLPFLFLPVLSMTACDGGSSDILDSSFGTGGKVTIDFLSAQDNANAIALQSDGKILVGGKTTSGTSSNFALARLNTDGSLDTTFDGDGKTTINFDVENELNGIAVQADGKIVVVGSAVNGVTSVIAVARLNTDGSLDTSFDGDGKLTRQQGTFDEANAVGMSEGNILVGASVTNGGEFDWCLLRFQSSDGALDTTFDNDGIVTTSFGDDDKLRSLSVTSTGQIIAAGVAQTGTNKDFGIARYNSNGLLDGTFATGGKNTANFVTSPSSSDDEAFGATITSDGFIIAAGTSSASDGLALGLARFTSTGTLDIFNFGSNGTVRQMGVAGRAVTAGFDGRLTVVGSMSASGGTDMAISRFDIDGTASFNFGTDGTLTVDFNGQTDEATAIAAQSDGKLVVAGRSFNGSHYDFAVARLTR